MGEVLRFPSILNLPKHAPKPADEPCTVTVLPTGWFGPQPTPKPKKSKT
jgi:hypothetical protein